MSTLSPLSPLPSRPLPSLVSPQPPLPPYAPEGLDRRLLVALRDCGADARIAAVARALSHSGEHGALWIAAGLAGAAADRRRRAAWLRGTALICGAHLASMAVKRAVRRPRPHLPARRAPLVRTAGAHSFPSSHAASAAAAAVALGALAPAGAALPVVAAAMCVSRMVVGVHYPSDVLAGAALGALTARIGAPWMHAAPCAPITAPITAPGGRRG